MVKMAAPKSQRSANFTYHEKALLLDLYYKNKKILENKATDSLTTKKKEETWIQLASDYNSVEHVVNREWPSLRVAFENIKKKFRKDQIDICQQLSQPEIYFDFGTTCLDDISKRVLRILDNRFAEIEVNYVDHDCVNRRPKLEPPASSRPKSAEDESLKIDGVSSYQPSNKFPFATERTTPNLDMMVEYVCANLEQPELATEYDVDGVANENSKDFPGRVSASPTRQQKPSPTFKQYSRQAERLRPYRCLRCEKGISDKLSRCADAKAAFYRRQTEIAEEEHELKMTVMRAKLKYYDTKTSLNNIQS